MRVAYLSYPWFGDIDLSFVHAIRKKVDLYYFIVVSPSSLKSTAFNLKKQHPASGIFKADIYPELKNFSSLCDFDKTFVINLYGKTHNFRNYSVIIKLFIFLMHLHIDVLHTTLFYSLRYFLLYFFHKKTILTVHDPIPHSDEKSKKVFFYRHIAFLLLKNFLVLNVSQKDEFVFRYRLKNKNVFVSKLGVYNYLNIYSQDKISCFNTNDYILFFGRITSYKGLDYLLPAMKIVHETHKNIKLIVAGYCRSFYFDISEYENCPYIEIINRYIPDKILVPLIKNALFVVCPYIDATQSGVVMSAYALNTPVLATNVGGLTEYVEHLKSGYIIPPRDINALVEGINYLLKHREILKDQKKYIAEEYANNRYSWNKITDDILGLYTSVISEVSKSQL